MSEFSAFFAQNVTMETTEEFIVSDRFFKPEVKIEDGKWPAKRTPIPWKLRTLSESENEEIRKSATRMVKGPNGLKVPETKPEEYMGKLAVASVTYPDLKNADLQKSYGVLGAEDLLKKMLLAGEYATLIQKVQQMNGYDRDINELKEEVKNG